MGNESIHNGHRHRMRERIKEYGPQSLKDHELLEVLLYYAVPRKNTNPTAHEIIKEYGSLYNALTADYRDIADRCGISENAALLLNLVTETAKRAAENRWEKGMRLNSTALAGEFCVELLSYEKLEVFYLLCLDAGNRLIYPCRINSGSAVDVTVYIRSIVEAALRYKAANVILLHNHPGGEAFPTVEDERLTEEICDALEKINIGVVDHIIVSGKNYFSLADNSFFTE